MKMQTSALRCLYQNNLVNDDITYSKNVDNITDELLNMWLVIPCETTKDWGKLASKEMYQIITLKDIPIMKVEVVGLNKVPSIDFNFDMWFASIFVNNLRNAQVPWLF